MKTKNLLLFALILALLTACQPAGPSAKDLAETKVASDAQTAEAAPPTPTDTPAPTDTPQPTATITATPEPTLTSTPAGPLTFKDDFSKENKEAWDCTVCKWQDGAFVLGPYEAGSNLVKSLHYNVCKACGAHVYYHFKVEATFKEGQVDRFFGIIAGISEKSAIYLGISPWGFYTVRDYDLENIGVKQLASKQGVVKTSRATNVFEVDAKPGANGTVDYSITLNGRRVYLLSGKPATPTTVGLGMSFHAVTVAYDNFEYEELVP